MFKKVSEYFKVRKENKEERNDAIEKLIAYLPEMENDFRKIFRSTEFIDIRTVNDYKNKYKNVYDKATSYYHDGMEAKKKLPAKYDDPLKKIISIFYIIDKRRETHNKNLEKDISPECKDIFDKIGIQEPTKAQMNSVVCEDKHILLFGGISTGKKTSIKAKIQLLKDKNLIENKDFFVFNGNDTSNTSNIASLLLREHDFKCDYKNIDEDNLYKSIKSFINENISDFNFRNRLVDYYLNYHSYGKTVFDFETRAEYEKYISFYKPVSLKNEIMKSYEEKIVADFLYCSGIEYKYNSDFAVDYTLNGARSRYKPVFQLVDYNICINLYELDNNENAFCDIDEFTDELGEERIYNATSVLNNKIAEIRTVHSDAEIELIECYRSQMQNNELVHYLERKLSEKAVKFAHKPNDSIINDIISVEIDFIDILVEIIMRTVETILASGENENSIINSSRTKSKTTSLFYKRRERILSIILPYYNHYLESFPMDEYRYLFKATEFIKDYNISFSIKYIFVINAENLNRAAADFIHALALNSNAKIIFSGCDWLCHNGIKGANPVYYMDFGRFYPGFQEFKFDTVFNIPKQSYDVIKKFALNKTGNFEYRQKINNINGTFIKKLNVKFNNLISLKENLIKFIESQDKDKSVLIACLYQNEVEFFNSIISSIDNKNICCKNIIDSNDKYDVVIWTNTKYSGFGFPDERITLSDVSGIILSRPDSKMHLFERNMLCKATTLAKNELLILIDDEDVSDYASELDV